MKFRLLSATRSKRVASLRRYAFSGVCNLRLAGRRRSLAFVASLFLVLAVMQLGGTTFANAKVFTGQKQALAEAFPDATRTERKSKLILSADMAKLKALTQGNDIPRVVVLHVAF